MHKRGPPVYGVVAEFTTSATLLAAAQLARAHYQRVEAYTPCAVEGLPEALRLRKRNIPLITLLGALAGGIGTYFLQWYSATVDYPFNSGGRPLHSWPAFLLPTFEMTVLSAVLAAFLALLFSCGLPRLRHPIFDSDSFSRVSNDTFLLCIRSDDPRFGLAETRRLLTYAGAVKISEL